MGSKSEQKLEERVGSTGSLRIKFSFFTLVINGLINFRYSGYVETLSLTKLTKFQ